MVKETIQRMNGTAKWAALFAVLLTFTITGTGVTIHNFGKQEEQNKKYDEHIEESKDIVKEFRAVQTEIAILRTQNDRILSELNDIKRILAEGERQF